MDTFRCLGIDLHSDNLTVASLDLKDSKITRSTYCIQGPSFGSFLASLRSSDYILVESTTNAFWFYEQVKERVKKCLVYDTNKIRQQGNKTDKIDAARLARKLAYYIFMGEDGSELPTVYVPPMEACELRSLFATYNFYKKMVNKSKNRIHSILKQNGLIFSKAILLKKDISDTISSLKIPSRYIWQIQTLYSSLKAAVESQEKVKDQIYLLGNKLFRKEIDILLSITGFSPLTAIAFMSDVVDINRFETAKKICSYLRTAPNTKESNNKSKSTAVSRNSRSTTVVRGN